jgi:hypothetical protein
MEIHLRHATQHMCRYMASDHYLSYRKIALTQCPQAHRSCLRWICFALPLIAVDAKLKPLLMAMSDKIRSYAELRELIRLSLRAQHPEWIEPNGDSPTCDSYEARFAELLGLVHPRKRDAAAHRLGAE